MNNDRIINTLMADSKIKNLGLKEELVSSIIRSYEDLVVDELLDKGYIYLNNGMNIEIVQLTDRIHVLRGIPYQSSRKYKLKLTMDGKLYDRIEEYYERLKEEIN